MAYKGSHNNKKTLDSFMKRVLTTVKEAEVKSLTQASQFVVYDLVQNAKYNDFTGSLNASYVAGIYHNGKFVRRTGTSLPFADTAPISAKKDSFVEMRNKRVSVRRGFKGITTKTTHYGKGFGHRTNKLRAMSPKGEYTVLITNTAPYAEEVQQQPDRRVMLGNSNKYAGTFIRLLRSNLKTTKR